MINLKLLPFQRAFIAGASGVGVRTAALSVARGNGKSTLAGMMAADALKAAKPYQEIALVAGSLEMGRIVFQSGAALARRECRLSLPGLHDQGRNHGAERGKVARPGQ